ncbi:hypothetical protein [Planomonospora venezuelensis]|uniref:Uncharacterized protein n=1 Tax=Planomonospora venezuelensis TaxID=1999 RepID=A0A841DGS4_PLAVE|nr:hypothetical protein [Planomonospora venezuelensis]MBB5967923.1 hypothetical protein [Planomonospora venezuelensis]GIN03349.1 hypothetical protein Pve01_50070 [Planomonospora venezuelensis]
MPVARGHLAEPSVIAAEELQTELERQGIAADVHDGYGLALVSVWVDLVVWSDGECYWWRTGWNTERRRTIYAWHPATDPVRAARRVARRYEDLRGTQPLPEWLAGRAS